MEREIELQHLRKAEADIVAARERIERQTDLVERLKKDGHDAAGAQEFLATMRQTLAVMEAHRETILSELRTQTES